MKRTLLTLVLVAGILAGALAAPLPVHAQTDDDESTWLIVPDNETSISGTVTLKVGASKDLSDHVHTYEKDDEAQQPWYLLKNTSKWTSSNPDIASVSDNGVVTGHRNGVATIKMTGYDNLNRTHVQTITVRVFAGSGSGTSSKKNSSFTLPQGVRIDLSVLVDPSAYSKIEWSSSTAAASVDSSGLATADNVGNSTITATCTDAQGNAVTRKFSIRVLTHTLLNNTRECTIYLEKGQTVDLLSLFYPAYDSIGNARKSFTLRTNNVSSAPVGDYTVTAKVAGTSTVTVTETVGITDTVTYKAKVIVR